MVEIELEAFGEEETSPRVDAPPRLHFFQAVYEHFKNFWKSCLAAKILLYILLVLVLMNSRFSFAIFRVFGFNQNIKVSPNELQLTGKVDLDRILKEDGILKGVPNKTLEICSDDQIIITARPNKAPESIISIDRRFVNITGVVNFHSLGNEENKGDMLYNHKTVKISKRVEDLIVPFITTSTISSPPDKGIKLRSAATIEMRARKGMRLTGGNIVVSTMGNITLESTNGTIILGGQSGVQFHSSTFPWVTENEVRRGNGQVTSLTNIKENAETFILCTCRKEEKLFRLRIPANRRPKNGRWRCFHAKNPPCF